MKAAWIILLALALMMLCVVTFRYATRPSRPAPAPVAALQKTAPLPRRSHRRISRKPSVILPIEPVDITGPLRDRGIVRMVIPPYPEWAEEQGISGAVSVKIWAKPDGRVSSFMQVVRSTPYPKLDAVALSALPQWQFLSISNATGDQWGVVTFRFVLETRVSELLPEDRTTAWAPPSPLKPVFPAYQ